MMPILLLFLCQVAVANTPIDTAPIKQTQASTEAQAPKKIYKSTEKHQFSGSRLKGHLKKPELSYIYQRKGLRAERIVRVPEDFNEEINSGSAQF